MGREARAPAPPDGSAFELGHPVDIRLATLGSIDHGLALNEIRYARCIRNEDLV
ncbi:hypothetical protein MAHJHV57_43210 [Mycobacterium avium subsp. hominissuis]